MGLYRVYILPLLRDKTILNSLGKMTEGINIELALELSEAICRSAGTELSDLIYVAERLKTAEDLENVHAEGYGTWPPGVAISVNADYIGPIFLWKRGAIGSHAERTHEQAIFDYFKDLGDRTGLIFQTFKQISGTYTPTIHSRGFCKFSIETRPSSGKPLNIIVTQYYTYEQELAHRASREK